MPAVSGVNTWQQAGARRPPRPAPANTGIHGPPNPGKKRHTRKTN